MSTDDLTEITPEEARELVTRANNEGRGRLSLNGLTQISTDVARELAKSTGCLRLRGLTLIPPDVARELKQGLTVLLWPDWFAAESDGPALDP